MQSGLYQRSPTRTLCFTHQVVTPAKAGVRLLVFWIPVYTGITDRDLCRNTTRMQRTTAGRRQDREAVERLAWAMQESG